MDKEKEPGFKLAPEWWSGGRLAKKDARAYRNLWIYTVLITGFVALAPLSVMTAINYFQYQKALRNEIIHPLSWITQNGKETLEFLLEERRYALNFVIQEKSFEELSDQKRLHGTFLNLKKSFGRFADLGLIDSEGKQRSYVGPYSLMDALSDKNYRDQDWFQEVSVRGSYVSNVFPGYRRFPHFVIAVRRDKENGDFFILRATIDTEILDMSIRSLDLGISSDAFLMDREGILQTASRFYGKILEKCRLPVPPYSGKSEIVELAEPGENLVASYAYVDGTPFILVLVKQTDELMRSWFALRSDILFFFVFSVGLILAVILWASTHLINRMYEADLKRAQFAHGLEYTSKLASIGRLAAGVAHEINNPLAIINEKAGLLKDLVGFTEGFPDKERFLRHVDSITKSVERCSSITHRLLGFAKRMDVQTETIDLGALLKEVLSFLEKEAAYRNIRIDLQVAPDVPSLASDRNQLQQVFLNIVNNAFAAVDQGGRIQIDVRLKALGKIAISIEDNGSGISPENLKHIFEPFFTTKKEHGTGLGLSITYGIVEKLGGTIDVQSELKKGTTFTVTLPISRSEP